jgi:hypothetical protein
MRSIAILCCSVAVGLGGCALESETDDEQNTEAQSSAELTFVTGSRGCTGYSSGGGQRVTGSVRTITNNKGNGQYEHYVELRAVNWIRNIGWNTKRTSQLRIEGTLSTGPNPFDTVVPVYWDSSGALTTEIFRPLLFLTNTSPNFTVLSDVTFYGRHGSSCVI